MTAGPVARTVSAWVLAIAVVAAAVVLARTGSGVFLGVDELVAKPTGALGSLGGVLPFGYAFAAGMLAAVNPCGFALLPGYLGLYLGETEPTDSPAGRLARALRTRSRCSIWKDGRSPSTSPRPPEGADGAPTCRGIAPANAHRPPGGVAGAHVHEDGRPGAELLSDLLGRGHPGGQLVHVANLEVATLGEDARGAARDVLCTQVALLAHEGEGPTIEYKRVLRTEKTHKEKFASTVVAFATGATQAVPDRVRCVHNACTACRDHPAPPGTGRHLGPVLAIQRGTIRILPDGAR